MVNTPLHDPLSTRVLDIDVESISQVEGTQGGNSLLPRSRQGSQPQLLQQDSYRASAALPSLLPSRPQHHAHGDGDNDNMDEEDEDEDEETSETQPVLMSKSSRAGSASRRPSALGKCRHHSTE